jgi:hypothetical protein
MTSKATTLVVALALLVPALAAAKPGHGPAVKAAVKACVQERKENGREAFVQTYGHPAQRNCVKQALPEARNAAQECRAERDDLGVDAFREQYGVPSGARNAFGKCVSGKVNQSSEQESGGTEQLPPAS